jgi:hypothetical protein
MKTFLSFSLLLILIPFSGSAQGKEVSRRTATVVSTTPFPSLVSKANYIMDFESVPDFSLTFDLWKVRDIDSSNTFTITDHTFPHSGQPIAFIAFNPSQVNPAMTDPFIQPHSGQRFGACISATNPPNNDWFISPKIQLRTGGSFNFWVKSYTSNYGLEKYKVGVSTTSNNPSAFTFISGGTPLLADTAWTKKFFSLSAYNNQEVYVAIQCVSDTAFIFMIDDLEVNPGDTTGQLPSSASLDFEDLPDFSLDFFPWTLNDVNGGNTYGIENCTFPHNGSPMAYICFNPSKALPPPLNMHAYSGDRFGACFSSMPPRNPNNKWMISPRIQPENNAKIALWVQSYNVFYGYEKFNIGVSTTGNDPSDFTIISGARPDSAPVDWVRKIYSLANYANQPIYVGIQCVTDTGFCFMVDDIEIGSSVDVNQNHPMEGLSVYPNPAKGKLYIDFGDNKTKDVKIEIYDIMGKMVRKYGTEEITGTTFIAEISDLDQGIYLMKIGALGITVTKKFIIER